MAFSLLRLRARHPGHSGSASRRAAIGSRRKSPRERVAAQTIGAARLSVGSASPERKFGTISGGGAKTSGIVADSRSSPRMSHREKPPMIGDDRPNTTLD